MYYLNRHIDVDGDSHGPMAEQMIANLCGDDDLEWQLAEESAIRALQSRITFWDGLLEQIQLRSAPSDRGAAPQSNIAIGDHLLASAIQLGWLDGLSSDEISQQLQMPRGQIEAIVGTPDDDSVGPTQLGG